MNATEAQVVHGSADNATLKRIMAGEVMGEATGSVAVIALAIASLAGERSLLLASVATIVLGAAFLIEGGILAGAEAIERGQVTTTEFLGGVGTLVLGILALLGVAQVELLSVAIIVFGGTLLFSHMTGGEELGARALVAIAVIVLGILAVVGLDQAILVSVSLLVLGGMELIAGLGNGARLTAANHAHARQV